jgi:nucleoside-diphosphate-sugar epimerase
MEGLVMAPPSADGRAGGLRVLVTGHDGYVGHVLVPLLQRAGHQVVGLDSFLFEDCRFPGQPGLELPAVRRDIREVETTDLGGFDAVVHLAALSNDPLGDLEPAATYAINHAATVRLARLAKAAGVGRFVFSSSCSNYGAAKDGLVDERGRFNPLTPYARSKVLAEHDLAALADDRFSPTFLRSATAYGMSAKLRADLVVNNLLGYAVTTGRVLLKSMGTSWRPLVHVEDIALAFRCVIEAPREAVHNQAFNVGQTGENYRVREIAAMVAAMVPGAEIATATDAAADARSYRVACDKLPRTLPDFRPRWTLRQGIEQVHQAYRAAGLTETAFLSTRYFRVRHVQGLLAAGLLDPRLVWRRPAA